MIIPQIMHFEIITLNFHRMIDMHSRYDNMYKKGIFYALNCINIQIDYIYKLYVITYPR